MSGAENFEAFIAGVERLESMNADVAKAALKPVTDVARASAAAGEAPDGTPWASKKDGGQALEGAAAAIHSSASGKKIELKIGPPFVFHNFGAGGSSETTEAVRHRARTAARQEKSGVSSKFHAPKRQILPTPGEPIPEAMKSAIAESAARVFGKAVG